MPISLAPLSESNAAAAQKLLLRFWHQNWPAEFGARFFQWRYRERPRTAALLAFDGDKCVATIGAMIRTYLLGGNQTQVCETCDWFCLPEYRQLGLGLKLIREVMERPEPIIVVGGTDATRGLLPRLGWQVLPEVGNYFLPLSGRVFAAFGLRRFRAGSERWARAIPSGINVRRVRQAPPPSPSAEMFTLNSGPPSLPTPPVAEFALAALLDGENLEWLARAPSEVGKLAALEFRIDGAPVAVSISMLETRPEGPCAKILHFQSSTPDLAVVEWIVSETAMHLASRGAGLIFCRASCPLISSALRRTGFLAGKPFPAFCWPAGLKVPAGPMHLTRLVGDDSIEFRSG